MNDKVLIIPNHGCYDIIMEDGSLAEFDVNEQNSRFKSLKEAMSVCQSHGYFFTKDDGCIIEMSYKNTFDNEGL